jgi:methylated-DNA-[protein]-cysteine S-methyltransferase
MLLIDLIASPLGCIAIAARAGRLCALEFGSARLGQQLTARYPGLPQRRARNPFGLSDRIRAYLAGDIAALGRIRVETGGTPFQRRVWGALRRIPPGRTMTYGALARALGRDAAARAVGAANGRNPIPVVVPCHRLIGGDDSLTGYGGGLWRKRWLLRHEAARTSAARAPRTGSGRPRDRSR